MKLADQHTPPTPLAPARQHRGATALAYGALVAAAVLAVTGCSSGQLASNSVALAGATRPMRLSSDIASNYKILKINDTRASERGTTPSSTP